MGQVAVVEDPRKLSAPKRPRIQAELSERSYKRLQELQELVGAESLREVLRDALSVYDWYVTRTVQQGCTIHLTTKDGQTVAVDLLGL